MKKVIILVTLLMSLLMISSVIAYCNPPGKTSPDIICQDSSTICAWNTVDCKYDCLQCTSEQPNCIQFSDRAYCSSESGDCNYLGEIILKGQTKCIQNQKVICSDSGNGVISVDTTGCGGEFPYLWIIAIALIIGGLFLFFRNKSKRKR